MPPEVLVTTSWDDGAPEDVRIAELLTKHNLPGRFYAPRSNSERPVLEPRVLAELGGAFELGAHTMNHVRLTRLTSVQARAEIRDSKRWLEDLSGRPVSSFCYPGGRFTANHVKEVEDAGFTSARTADWLSTDFPADPFRVAPSVHVFPHTREIHLLHCLRRRHFASLAAYVGAGLPTGIVDLTGLLLGRVLTRGGMLHIWGHSWEIDALGLWGELDAIFTLLADAGRDVTFVNNETFARRLRLRPRAL